MAPVRPERPVMYLVIPLMGVCLNTASTTSRPMQGRPMPKK